MEPWLAFDWNLGKPGGVDGAAGTVRFVEGGWGSRGVKQRAKKHKNHVQKFFFFKFQTCIIE